jgi:hypothetical protein
MRRPRRESRLKRRLASEPLAVSRFLTKPPTGDRGGFLFFKSCEDRGHFRIQPSCRWSFPAGSLLYFRLDEPARLPQTDRDRPLREVLEDFGRCLRPDGPYGGIDEWSIYDESFRRLVRWSVERECRYETLEPVREGGREHDVTHDPGSNSWLKFTKSARAGYMISFDSGLPTLEPALPLEYLDRLILQNEVFADRISFVGVAGDSRQPRIVTRQPDIAGEAAGVDEIREVMIDALGFSPLPTAFALGYADSLAFARHDVAVFDLRPANVVKTPAGVVVPIDVIAVQLDDRSRTILGIV